MKKKCDCRYCERRRKIARVVASGDRQELVEMIRSLEDTLCNVEEDLNYKSAILDGSWPNAREIMTRAIVKIDAGAA